MKIVGHEQQIEYLNRVIQRGRMSHAYIFYGPAHIGKLTIAKTLAGALLCKNNAGVASGMIIERGCGKCTDCRAIEGHTHPHTVILDRAHALVSEKEERSHISIADIRELTRLFRLAPEGDTWRIAIINEADTMNQEASNGFLKLLEEPGTRTIFILVTAAPELLLSTVRSRAHALRFSLVPQEKIAAFLETIPGTAERTKEIAADAAGRPGIAIQMAENAQYRERRQKFTAQFQIAQRAGLPHLFLLSRTISQDEELREQAVEEMLCSLQRGLRNAPGGREAIGFAKKIHAVDRIATLLETTNVQNRLAMDAIFVEYMK